MKICVVSRGDLNLFPPTEGGAVKLFYTLKGLSNHLKVYFVTAEKKFYYEIFKGKFRKKSYPKLLENSRVGKIHKKILQLLGLPTDIFVLYHPLVNLKLWLKVLYVVKKEKIDILQAEFTAFGIPTLFVKFLTSKPVVLVEHNVETFQLPRVTRLGVRGKKVVEWVEKLVCKGSNRIIVMCEAEKKRLLRLRVCKKKIKVIPHGVDLSRFKKVKNVKKIKRKYGLKFPVLVFHGVFSYKPNVDAIKFLIRKILPALEKKKIKVKLLAIGNYPPSFNHPNVIFTGVVKDLPNFIAAGDIAVVPLTAGGGMRLKILEYFAAKKPVLATQKAIEGIPAKNNQHALIVPLKKFLPNLLKLIKDERLRKKLSRNAFQLVQTYDWKNICKKYLEVYEELRL